MAQYCTSRTNLVVGGVFSGQETRSYLLVSISSIVITNARHKSLITVTPNSYPAARLVGKPDPIDYKPISYVQVHSRKPRPLPIVLTDSIRIPSPPI